MENNPPATVVDFNDVVATSGPLSSEKETRAHRKCSPLMNAPHTTGDELWESVSALMISITRIHGGPQTSKSLRKIYIFTKNSVN